MPPFKHLLPIALFFVFGILALMADARIERLHWAALAIIATAGSAFLAVWDGIRAGRIHHWTSVIHRHNRPQLFWAATGTVAAGAIILVAAGLWVLSW